ncbi:MAG: head-tail adaptor protein [Alphaproteobacteria bacterium]|nr:head-tail adaptor protein [Alphaproteobacteria bacterium]
MRAGKLTHTVKVMRPTYVDDGFGTMVPGPVSVVATLRAQLVEESTDEFIRNYGGSTERVRIFRVRWIDGITLADQIEHDGIEFNLKQIKEIGRRRGLELRCTANG